MSFRSGSHIYIYICYTWVEMEFYYCRCLKVAKEVLTNSSFPQVPKGHCYIVGDNLPWSRDSRDFGPIPLALIKGKVIAKACLDGWNPMNWFTRFENGLKKPADISDSSPSSQGP